MPTDHDDTKGPASALRSWLRGDAREMLQIERDGLQPLSPFHLLLTPSGRILQSGQSLQKLLGGDPKGQWWGNVLQPATEADGLSQEQLHALNDLSGRALPLQLHAPLELELIGQLVPLQTSPTLQWLLDLRPVLETLEDLEQSGLSLQDLSLIDPIRTGMVTLLMEKALRQELLGALHENGESEAQKADATKPD